MSQPYEWLAHPDQQGRDYCTGDPVNCTDLDGNWGMPKWLKKTVEVVAKVAEVAAYIPGPIGAVAAAVSSVSYAATGNWAKAAEMAVTAVAQVVGAGPVVKVAVAVAATVRAAARASRVASRESRGASAAKAVHRVVQAKNQVAKAKYGNYLANKYNGTRSRVTIEVAKGQWHYDLKGKPHIVKRNGGTIPVPTPHKVWQPNNPMNKKTGWGKPDRNNTKLMTWRELRKVSQHLRK
ncbi:hypothetical protein [Kitasatospora sp. NPDC059327]|uniref:hypothetical protein n=1 Tax=Kitasatospora sp. NPDC059327 TaxID=3346803 RepID=UPI0036A8AAFB